MQSDFSRVLLRREEIGKRVAELAAEIDRDYAGKTPLFVGILKGSVFFFTDLLQQLHIPAQLDFMSVSSYGNGDQTSGRVRIMKDLDRPIAGQHVVIVEDIIDSGTTLSYLKRLLESRNPASVRICTLLDKPDRRRTEVAVDYRGFVIPDEFIVGYGLDYAERYRLEPDIYVLDPHVYGKE